MALSLYRMFRKTVKRGANVVRRVGKAATRTVKRGTNSVGLTRRKSRKSRKSHKGRKGGRKH